MELLCCFNLIYNDAIITKFCICHDSPHPHKWHAYDLTPVDWINTINNSYCIWICEKKYMWDDLQVVKYPEKVMPCFGTSQDSWRWACFPISFLTAVTNNVYRLWHFKDKQSTWEVEIPKMIFNIEHFFSLRCLTRNSFCGLISWGQHKMATNLQMTFNTKPLLELMLTYCQFNSQEPISVQFYSQHKNHFSNKMRLKMVSTKCQPFCAGLTALRCHVYNCREKQEEF